MSDNDSTIRAVPPEQILTEQEPQQVIIIQTENWSETDNDSEEEEDEPDSPPNVILMQAFQTEAVTLPLIEETLKEDQHTLLPQINPLLSKVLDSNAIPVYGSNSLARPLKALPLLQSIQNFLSLNEDGNLRNIALHLRQYTLFDITTEEAQQKANLSSIADSLFRSINNVQQSHFPKNTEPTTIWPNLGISENFGRHTQANIDCAAFLHFQTITKKTSLLTKDFYNFILQRPDLPKQKGPPDHAINTLFRLIMARDKIHQHFQSLKTPTNTQYFTALNQFNSKKPLPQEELDEAKEYTTSLLETAANEPFSPAHYISFIYHRRCKIVGHPTIIIPPFSAANFLEQVMQLIPTFCKKEISKQLQEETISYLNHIAHLLPCAWNTLNFQNFIKANDPPLFKDEHDAILYLSKDHLLRRLPKLPMDTPDPFPLNLDNKTQHFRPTKKIRDLIQYMHASKTKNYFLATEVYNHILQYIRSSCCQILTASDIPTIYATNAELADLLNLDFIKAEDIPTLIRPFLIPISASETTPLPSWTKYTSYNDWSNQDHFELKGTSKTSNDSQSSVMIKTIQHSPPPYNPTCVACGGQMNRIFSVPYGYRYQCQKCPQTLVIPFEMAQLTETDHNDAYFLRSWNEPSKPIQHQNSRVQKALINIQQASKQQGFFRRSRKLMIDTTFKDIKKLPEPLSIMLQSANMTGPSCQNNPLHSLSSQNGQPTG
jgi:hypothetical protein